MKNKITIAYFPLGLKYATPLVFGAGIYLAFIGYFGWCIVLILLVVVILTTNYVTEINLTDKKYNDYLSLLWIPLNEETNGFNSLDRIVVRKGNYSQMLNTRWRSRQLDWSDYTATLIMDNGTLDLLTRNSKKELMGGLKEFADLLKVGVEDRTTNEYYWVDLTRVK